jgi:DNA-binding transcriptional LysR family regulator
MTMSRPIRSPEVNELRAFCAAVDLGSIGQAARLLRISQPALSKRLRGLEAIAGTDLLQRSPTGVEPTAAGRELYDAARKVLAQVEVVEDMMAGISRANRPIRIAASHTVAEYVLPSRLATFEEEHESVHSAIELVVANSPVALDFAARGHADLAIAALAPGQPEPAGSIPFFVGEVVVAVPRGHRWNKLDEIPLDEFLETKIIMRDPSANSRQVVEAALAERGYSLPPALLELGSTPAVRKAVIQRRAAALIAKLAIVPESEGIAAKRVAGLRFARHFVIVAPARESLSSNGKALIEHLLSIRDELKQFYAD